MDSNDALAVLAVIGLWIGVFASVVIVAFGGGLDGIAKRGTAPSREEFMLRVGPPLKFALPVFWISAGLTIGLIAAHPIQVAFGLFLVRLAVFLMGGERFNSLGMVAKLLTLCAVALALGAIIRSHLSQ